MDSLFDWQKTLITFYSFLGRNINLLLTGQEILAKIHTITPLIAHIFTITLEFTSSKLKIHDFTPQKSSNQAIT